MGRFDSISTIIRMLLDAVGVQPQPWMGIVAFALLVVTLGPSVRRNLATGRARKLIVGLADLEAEPRQARVDQILALVDGNPDGLVAIADEALRRRQAALAREAYRRLRLTGKRARDQVRLEEELNGPLPRHVDEEVATVERLIEAGALERAEQRLRRAQAVFPRDERLHAVADHLARARAAS